MFEIILSIAAIVIATAGAVKISYLDRIHPWFK